ncbi:MarR family winged helix-turn-helix transcriptional regulator [Clostridium sp. UBA4548]|uniref:MarR family winged helix-turn-helix transcriptional regulator n=1 Tax=Clostridium sp. UBA4548 TaxID=1946361 RepID=UPI0025C5292C|nr:MarR family transcriptional regulator [Clostridium sp. UBA4548]
MFYLDDCIGIITSRGTKHIIDAFNNRLAVYNITRVQWIALYYIGRNEGITQKELSEEMDLKESTVARLIDRLEKENTVQRIKDAKDRRISKLYLTEEGKEKREALLPIGENFSNEAIKGISENDLEIFKEVLNKIVINLMEEQK